MFALLLDFRNDFARDRMFRRLHPEVVRVRIRRRRSRNEIVSDHRNRLPVALSTDRRSVSGRTTRAGHVRRLSDLVSVLSVLSQDFCKSGRDRQSLRTQEVRSAAQAGHGRGRSEINYFN